MLFNERGGALDHDSQDDAVPVAERLPTVAVLGAALALAACGDGGGGGGATGSAPTPTPPPIVVIPPTDAQASRFLGQATMGATRAAIDAAVARGFDGWLTDQFANDARDLAFGLAGRQRL